MDRKNLRTERKITNTKYHETAQKDIYDNSNAVHCTYRKSR